MQSFFWFGCFRALKFDLEYFSKMCVIEKVHKTSEDISITKWSVIVELVQFDVNIYSSEDIRIVTHLVKLLLTFACAGNELFYTEKSLNNFC